MELEACHHVTDSARLPQPDYSPVVGAQPFCGPGRAFHLPLCYRTLWSELMSLGVRRGSSIPHLSSSIPAGIVCVPCSRAARPGSPHQPATHP